MLDTWLPQHKNTPQCHTPQSTPSPPSPHQQPKPPHKPNPTHTWSYTTANMVPQSPHIPYLPYSVYSSWINFWSIWFSSLIVFCLCWYWNISLSLLSVRSGLDLCIGFIRVRTSSGRVLMWAVWKWAVFGVFRTRMGLMWAIGILRVSLVVRFIFRPEFQVCRWGTSPIACCYHTQHTYLQASPTHPSNLPYSHLSSQ